MKNDPSSSNFTHGSAPALRLNCRFILQDGVRDRRVIPSGRAHCAPLGHMRVLFEHHRGTEVRLDHWGPEQVGAPSRPESRFVSVVLITTAIRSRCVSPSADSSRWKRPNAGKRGARIDRLRVFFFSHPDWGGFFCVFSRWRRGSFLFVADIVRVHTRAFAEKRDWRRTATTTTVAERKKNANYSTVKTHWHDVNSTTTATDNGQERRCRRKPVNSTVGALWPAYVLLVLLRLR